MLCTRFFFFIIFSLRFCHEIMIEPSLFLVSYLPKVQCNLIVSISCYSVKLTFNAKNIGNITLQISFSRQSHFFSFSYNFLHFLFRFSVCAASPNSGSWQYEDFNQHYIILYSFFHKSSLLSKSLQDFLCLSIQNVSLWILFSLLPFSYYNWCLVQLLKSIASSPSTTLFAPLNMRWAEIWLLPWRLDQRLSSLLLIDTFTHPKWISRTCFSFFFPLLYRSDCFFVSWVCYYFVLYSCHTMSNISAPRCIEVIDNLPITFHSNL